MLAVLRPGPLAEGEADWDRSRDVDCPLWWTCSGGAPVQFHLRDYYVYLNVTVRPALVSLSSSFLGAGCEALAPSQGGAEGGQDSILEPLREARETAREALKQAKSIVPPAPLAGFHDRFEGVLDSTVKAVDAVEECAQGSSSSCDDAQDQVGVLMTETAGLAEEAKAIGRL